MRRSVQSGGRDFVLQQPPRPGHRATPAWQWEESIQRGTDYASEAEVAIYDARMAEMRDVAGEAGRILTALDLNKDDVLMEIGTGTGAFARAAAKCCRKVIAVDVSPMMLSYAARRAREEGLDNIEFQEAGFLTCDTHGEPVAAIVTQLALHHLPDAWKLIALRRMANLLRRGGALCLTDVVFRDGAEDDWVTYVDELIASMPESSRASMARHLRQEFSTFDWMMRDILARAGFTVVSMAPEGSFLRRYLCRKSLRRAPVRRRP